jgi:hypothetical protein
MEKQELEEKLAVLEVKYEALLNSHRALAQKVYGGASEAAEFLAKIDEDIVDNFPESAK